LIHEGAGRWKQVWALLKKSLLPRQFQDEETIRKTRRKKTRSDKQTALFFKIHHGIYSSLSAVFSTYSWLVFPAQRIHGKNCGKPEIISKIAYDLEHSGKKKNLPVL